VAGTESKKKPRCFQRGSLLLSELSDQAGTEAEGLASRGARMGALTSSGPRMGALELVKAGAALGVFDRLDIPNFSILSVCHVFLCWLQTAKETALLPVRFSSAF
jgi:hypothetical protein